MRVILIHGYFLKGTGSNLFVKNVCRELCRLGHEVSLVCQEENAEDLDFIGEVYSFSPDNSRCELIHKKDTPYDGECRMYQPNLNGFLPVYVYDEYEGYTVKELKSCTREEIESYLSCNVKALDCLAEKLGHADLLWTNHTIMQPVYGARSQLRKICKKHVITVHGSCLNFAVREKELLQGYAWEAMAGAETIAFVSEFSKVEFQNFFRFYPDIEKKGIVISGGVDLDNFAPLPEGKSKNQIMSPLLAKLKAEEDAGAIFANGGESSWKTDPDVAEKLGRIDFEKEQIVLYYGKYLWTKGIQNLLAAVPLIMQCRDKAAHFVLVGYGSSRAYLEAMVEALDEGRRSEYLKLLKHPERFHAGIDPAAALFVRGLVRRLETDKKFAEDYFSTARGNVRKAVTFTGFLGHEDLRTLIACADVTVAPSIFPEAFGLVGLEALASGIVPVLSNHSGYGEVIRNYVEIFSEHFDKTKMYPLYPDQDMVLRMANNICVLLSGYEKMNEAQRNSVRQRARKISEDLYSWESVVRKYLRCAENVLLPPL